MARGPITLEARKVHYTIREMAESLNYTQSNIRYWIHFFGLNFCNDPKGTAMEKYDSETFEKLKKISKLKKEGYYLKAIKEKLR